MLIRVRVINDSYFEIDFDIAMITIHARLIQVVGPCSKNIIF